MHSGILRILDANCNRAREALRVIEDYAGFVLDDDHLCAGLKQLRHDLHEATSDFTSDAILHRDTPGDVGTATKTADELSRDDTGHVVTAAGKRLGEALRTIEEYLKTDSPSNASRIETIRYRFYDLEQRIARTLRPGDTRLTSMRLYVLITESLCKRPWLEVAQQAIVGGADCIQLREKELDGGELLKRAKSLVELCRRHHVISIINDRADIAMLSDADGVHVGQGDLPAVEARKIVGRGKIVGVSTHHLDQARPAVRDGADYIGIGPIFKSSTKPRDFLPGLEYARQIAAANLPIPAVAIAGITLENVDEILATGIKAVAVSSAVIAAADVRAAAGAVNAKLDPARWGRHSCLPRADIPVRSSVEMPGKESPGVAGKNACPTDNSHAATALVGQTFLSASSEGDVQNRRRRLPHWTLAGATYFVTFRIKHGEFSMPERLAILEHIKSGEGRFYDLTAAVVMPDHAHALFAPLPSFELPRVMKGLKGVAAKIVNDLRHSRGSIWQDESFDRIIRDQNEFEEKLKYIVDNPVKRELVAESWDYPALHVKFE